jgi:hypothetical protein
MPGVFLARPHSHRLHALHCAAAGPLQPVGCRAAADATGSKPARAGRRYGCGAWGFGFVFGLPMLRQNYAPLSSPLCIPPSGTLFRSSPYFLTACGHSRPYVSPAGPAPYPPCRSCVRGGAYHCHDGAFGMRCGCKRAEMRSLLHAETCRSMCMARSLKDRSWGRAPPRSPAPQRRAAPVPVVRVRTWAFPC